MDIGRTVTVYTVEPLVSPVPREREAPQAQSDTAPTSEPTVPTPVESR